jgi:type IV pilus assembly protein PilQ
MSIADKLNRLRLLGLCLASIVAGSASAADLTAIDVRKHEAGVRVEIAAQGDWSYRTFRMENPPRLVVDILGATNRANAARLAGDGRFVKTVRTSQYETEPAPISRIVFDLVGETDLDVQRAGDLLLVSAGHTPSVDETVHNLREVAPASDKKTLSLIGVAADPTDEIAAGDADHWQDPQGLDQVAQPQERRDDASLARTMTINSQSADIRTILRSIADFSGRNIIAAPAVEGTVTVALNNVPWREALTVILRAHGFAFVEENGIIRVDTGAALREEELQRKSAERRSDELEALVTRIVAIDFANAKEVSNSVKSMLTARGSVEVDDRTNALIVSDIPGTVDAVAALARELDTRTPQVHIDALLVDLDSRRSRELGVNWGGFNLDIGGNFLGDASVTAPITEVAGQVRVGTVQDFGEIKATVQALARENVADIISNPRITTTDNREANILVGQKIPLITQDVSGNPITRLETIGIRLVVTPHINSDSQITLDVHPEVSDLSSQATVQGGVIINTSEADTRVLVGNGETAVIGGLIRKLKTNFQSGVPVLKELPLVGALFRSESTNDEQRELIVFLTPTIVQDEGVATERQMKIREGVLKDQEKNRGTSD